LSDIAKPPYKHENPRGYCYAIALSTNLAIGFASDRNARLSPQAQSISFDD
jgi:hypothetical protein